MAIAEFGRRFGIKGKDVSAMVVEAPVLYIPQIKDYVDGTTSAADPRDPLWNEWAPHYEDMLALTETKEAWRRFVELIPQTQEPVAVLDAGCGTGEITVGVLERMPNAAVVAADKSTAFLNRIQQRLALLGEDARRVDLWRVDLVNPLPCEAERFDQVVSNYVFQYFSKEEQNRLVAEMVRVLKPGGRFQLSTFVDGRSFKEVAPASIGRDILRGNVVGAARALRRIGVTKEFDKLRSQGLMNHPSKSELEQMHKSAGFSDFQIVDTRFKGIEVFSVATK